MYEADYRYPCPLCRQGQLQPLTLMEAVGCNYCQHLFEWSGQQPLLVARVVDLAQPMSWRWNGQSWRLLRDTPEEATWFVWMTCGLLMLLPAFFVGFSSWLLPPITGSPLEFLPLIWTLLTAVAHLLLATWLLAEYHQWPFWLRWKLSLAQWRQRRSSP